MAMKDFDFKQFLLKRGEWVLLGVALALLLLLLCVGLPNVLFSGSASANAATLGNLTKTAEMKINQSTPPAGTDAVPEDIVKLSSGISFQPVDVSPFRTEQEWFLMSQLEDLKRRNPDVLAATEFQTDVVRAGVRGYIVFREKNHPRVMVLTQKGIVQGYDKRNKRFVRLQKQLGAGGGAGKGMGGPGAMGPGGGRGEGAGPPPGEGDEGRPGFGMRPQPGGAGTITRTELMDLDKVKDDTHLAETVYPIQMVVVSASFPLRQQLEEFRRALRKKSLTELLAMFQSSEATWQFLPLEIERRELAADGKPKTEWEPYSKKMVSELQQYMLVAAGPEEEDPELVENSMIPPGLVLRRPPLAPEGQPRAKYPELNLSGIKETLDELKKIGAEDPDKRPKSELAARLGRKDKSTLDFLWNAAGSVDEEEDKSKEQPAKSPREGDMKPKDGKDPSTDPDADLVLPKNVLVRFLDLTVKPGSTYEYRLKIKMANPNYKQKNVAYQKLAEKKEIEAAEWTVVPKVTVPHEAVWYVSDEKPDKDKATVQVHEWLATDRESGVPVGDWAILEKTAAYRGEYIGRTHDVEVPIWRTENEGYELAAKVGSKFGVRKIPVDFTVRAGNAQEPNLLIDIDGGKGVQNRIEMRNPDGKLVSRMVTDDSPVQLLVLTPEGMLILRNSADDIANEEREKRLKEWKDWVDLVKSGRKSGAGRGEDMFNKGAPGKGGGSGS
jgi:hypothetical protein